MALARQGDMDAGERELDAAVRLDPRLAAAYFELGIASAKKGNIQKAARSFAQCVRLDPRYHRRECEHGPGNQSDPGER